MGYYYRYLTAGTVATTALLDDRELLSVVRTSTQSVNNSTSLVADTVLRLPLAANATYHVSLLAVVSGPGAADWRQNWSAPTGAAGTRFTHGPSTGASSVRDNNVNFRSPSLSTILAYNTDGTEPAVLREELWVTTSATAGDLILQWAQNIATVGNTTMQSGSYLTAQRVV